MADVAGKCSRSWSIAWICSFINFLLLGVARMSGLLYLASINRYNVDRSRASLPFVLCYTVRNIAGPLIGYIGRKVEIRFVIASGCFVSAIGAGACFFAEDITTVTILWGGVYGLGFGLGTILLPEVLNQHFDKFISNANGIALGGECVAGFVLPVMVEFLLDTYGTSGSFLILSGLILHGVPAALLLVSPGTTAKTSNNRGINQSMWDSTGGEKYSPITCSEVHPHKNSTGELTSKALFHANDESFQNECRFRAYQVDSPKEKAQLNNTEHSNHSDPPLVTDPLVHGRQGNDYATLKHYSEHNCGNRYPITPRDVIQPTVQNISDPNSSNAAVTPDARSENKHCCIHSINQTLDTSGSKNYETLKDTSKQSSTKHHSIASCKIRPSAVLQNTLNHPNSNSCRSATTICSSRSASDPSKKLSFAHALRVFVDPAFILILLTQSSIIFIFTTVMTVIVDFSRDAGVYSYQEVYVLMCMSVADMVGRFGLGWVTDGGYMSNVAFSAVCYAASGLLIVALTFLRGFFAMMAVVFFIGLCLGGLLIVCPGIILDYIERDKVTMALASRFVLYAPMSLTQSSLIGYFRGRLGSYNGLFYILGVNCFICCAFSLLVPCAARLAARRRKETTAAEATPNASHRLTNSS